MPPKKKARLRGISHATQSERSDPGPASTPINDEESSDDPLAMTPIKKPHRTQAVRDRNPKQSTSRQSATQAKPPVTQRPRTSTRAGGRTTRSAVVFAIDEMDLNAGDLVPPSDEEEFVDWKAKRTMAFQNSNLPQSGPSLEPEEDEHGVGRTPESDRRIDEVTDPPTPLISSSVPASQPDHSPLFPSMFSPNLPSSPISSSRETSPTQPLSSRHFDEESLSLVREDGNSDNALYSDSLEVRDGGHKSTHASNEPPKPTRVLRTGSPTSSPILPSPARISPLGSHLLLSHLQSLKTSAGIAHSELEADHDKEDFLDDVWNDSLDHDRIAMADDPMGSWVVPSPIGSRGEDKTTDLRTYDREIMVEKSHKLAALTSVHSCPDPLSTLVPLSISDNSAVYVETDTPAVISSPPAIARAPSPHPPVDAALEQFRTARTFRTRTALQLQPYTKEKQKYTAALRRGGLVQVKKTVLPADEASSAEEDDEDQQVGPEPSQAEVEVEAPDRIVIGGTPPPPRTRRPKTPKPVTDDDIDTFIDQFGQAPNDDNEADSRRLQKIVRLRLREEKDERRRKREEEQSRREFDLIIKERQRELAGLDNEKENPPRKVGRLLPRQLGQPIRYGKKQKNVPSLAEPSDDSDDHLDRPPRQLPALTEHGANDSNGNDQATFDDMPTFSPIRYLDSPASITPSRPKPPSISPIDARHLSPRNLGEHSFYVDDLPHRRRRPPSPLSDSSTSSRGTPTHDRRQKIARRMMPAAMLKRLEREAAAKEASKAEIKRRAVRTSESPMRPGRAVIRRNGLDVDINDVLNLLADPDDSVDESVHGPLPSGRNGATAIPISDDSDADSLEAGEDNRAELRLLHLRQGDFESIVTGRRVQPPKSREQHRHTVGQTKKPHNARRPVLGLANRPRIISSLKSGPLRQSRLDFPLQDRSPNPGSHVKKKKKIGPTRPAIRLDDDTIFAEADFDFDSDSQRAATPRRRLPVATKKVAEVDTVDAGVGKARSWANFDKFPIDFDITPLPSGLYCSADSFVGDGGLARLSIELGRTDSSLGAIDELSEFGITISAGMDVEALLNVIPIIFDSVYTRVADDINGSSSVIVDFHLLDSLGRLVKSFQAPDLSILMGAIQAACAKLEVQVESLTLPTGRRGRPAHETAIRLRWTILVLNMRMLKVRSEIALSPQVTILASKVVSQLLVFGFDKTFKSLKSILRGDAESGEIEDYSVQMWISLIHVTKAWDQWNDNSAGDTFLEAFGAALDRTYRTDQVGPMAAERIWFMIFGLCAISQFDVHGRTEVDLESAPRWALVRRAVVLIKISHNLETEENANVEQLRGRDRYLKVMVARCVRLSATWKWNFDRDSFSVATRDLGLIFKQRQHRNLPTERPVDFPAFITQFDISLTADGDTKDESAFELYLRLACVAASDLISSAQTLEDAQQAEKDVQRLIMSIFPFSPVNFTRLLPPSARQLGALYNRYSTLVVACYFSPSLLSWVLANSRKWLAFDQADFESRQICIRGLMYLAVSIRHHQQPLEAVVARLADILSILQEELEQNGSSNRTQGPSRMEIERTMVLVVTCFRQIILHHSFDLAEQAKARYPDPCLLHESWTARVFDLDLARDRKSGLQIVSTIQAFLDTRAAALPRRARQFRESKIAESFDDYPSLGLEFDDFDLVALGGGGQLKEDPVELKDAEFAKIITTVICPKIYRLLSDMLPSVEILPETEDVRIERQVFIGKLTKCWSDCAAIVVIEHRLLDWSSYIGPFGQQSWARLGNDQGRIQVGLHFMTNVAKLDPGSFKATTKQNYSEEFIALLFQSIVCDRITIEHKYLSAVLAMPGFLEHPFFGSVGDIPGLLGQELDRAKLAELRLTFLEGKLVVFSNIPQLLRSSWTPKELKALVYRCVNLLISALISNEKTIDPSRTLQKELYHAFADTTVRSLQHLAGDFITPLSVPGLKAFVS